MYIKAFFLNIRLGKRYSSIYPASNWNFKEFLQGWEVFERKNEKHEGIYRTRT